jgi:hypothetical protein
MEVCSRLGHNGVNLSLSIQRNSVTSAQLSSFSKKKFPAVEPTMWFWVPALQHSRGRWPTCCIDNNLVVQNVLGDRLCETYTAAVGEEIRAFCLSVTESLISHTPLNMWILVLPCIALLARPGLGKEERKLRVGYFCLKPCLMTSEMVDSVGFRSSKFTVPVYIQCGVRLTRVIKKNWWLFSDPN